MKRSSQPSLSIVEDRDAGAGRLEQVLVGLGAAVHGDRRQPGRARGVGEGEADGAAARCRSRDATGTRWPPSSATTGARATCHERHRRLSVRTAQVGRETARRVEMRRASARRTGPAQRDRQLIVRLRRCRRPAGSPRGTARSHRRVSSFFSFSTPTLTAKVEACASAVRRFSRSASASVRRARAHRALAAQRLPEAAMRFGDCGR